MTIEKAIELLKIEYELAVQSEYVRKPIAYALGQVLVKAESEEQPKKKLKITTNTGEQVSFDDIDWRA